MNNEYSYIKGKGLVSVIDEHEKSRIVEYTDNIEDVLAQENLIEGIENNINELNNEYKKTTLFTKIVKIFVEVLLIYDIITIISTFIQILNFDAITPEVLEPIIVGVGGASLLLVPATIGVITISRLLKKEKTEYKNQHNYLESKLSQAKVKIYELRTNKTKDNQPDMEENLEFKKITTHKEYLQNLKEFILLFYNERKYRKYYEKGQLQSKLGVSDKVAEEIGKYFEENGNQKTNKLTNR